MKTTNGFTLIELLVVVLIIGILTVIAVPRYQKAVLKTKYTQVQVLGRAFEETVAMYYLANGVYPTSLEELDIQFQGTLSQDKKVIYIAGKYQCYLDIRNNSFDSLWCDLLSVPSGILSYRFAIAGVTGNQVGRFCVAQGRDNENICKLVGGSNPFDNGTGLIHYKLP